MVDLIQRISNSLAECNSIQIECGTTFLSMVQQDMVWIPVSGVFPHKFAGQKFMRTHDLVSYLGNTPHRSRRDGTLLIVSGIDLTKNQSLSEPKQEPKEATKIIEA